MKQRLLAGIALAAALLAGPALAQTSNDATGTTTKAGTSAAAMPQITEASEFVKQAADPLFDVVTDRTDRVD